MKQTKKAQKPKRYYTRTIDLFFLLIFLIISIISFTIAFSFGILPHTWVFMGAVVIFLIFIGLFLVSLRKMPKWFILVKRAFIIVLCVIIGGSGYFLNKSRMTINRMNQNAQSSITKLHILTAKNSNISSIKDLANKTIGFQNGVDKKNAAYAQKQLRSSIANMQVKEELDYTTLLSDLSLNEVQAIVMSDVYYGMSKSNMKDFEKQVTILDTIEKPKESSQKEEKDITEQPFTIYLSGLDNMGSPDQQTRTDTNLILIVNPKANHIDMVSLPRDGFIPNTALQNANDKLTHTGLYGVDASVETIEQFFNIPINYYARVSFNSLIEIVDTIGGIDVDVEINFCEQDENRSFKKEDLICLKKGKQHLNGKQALAYSRHRKTEGYDNAGRERAQQRIIKAIINKLISPSAITYINKLLDIAPNYVITNMPTSQITSFVSNELEDLKPWTISSISSDNGVYDNQYTASLSSEYGKSDVYLFAKNEVHAVVNAYDGASQPLDMSNYHFDVSNLYQDTPAINEDPHIVWDTMADNPH